MKWNDDKLLPLFHLSLLRSLVTHRNSTFIHTAHLVNLHHILLPLCTQQLSHTLPVTLWDTHFPRRIGFVGSRFPCCFNYVT